MKITSRVLRARGACAEQVVPLLVLLLVLLLGSKDTSRSRY
jgi:hypothetical protein